MNIDDFTFSPGDLFRGSIMTGLLGPTSSGAPVVKRGEKLNFVNHDYAASAARGTRSPHATAPATARSR